MRRFRVAAVLALAGTVAATSTATATTEPPDGGDAATLDFDLVVGSVLTLTGTDNVFGPSFEAAAELADEQIAAASDEAGVSVSLTLESADDETTPQGAVAAARRLVAADTSCIAGPLTSGSALAVAESVTIPEGIPNIAYAATSDQLTTLEDDGLVFRLLPSDALQAPALVQAIIDERGDAADLTLSLAARNDAFGEGFINAFKEAWEERGGTALGPVLYDPEGVSFDSEAQQVVEGDPDAYVVIDFPASYAIFGAALLRTGAFNGADLFVAGGQPATIPEDVPFDAMEGAVGTRPGVPEGSAPLDAFISLYEATDGLPPMETFAQNSFDAVMLCYLAALHAGSNDPAEIAAAIPEVSSPPGTPFSWLQLDEAIAALAAGEDIDFEGTSGAVDFDGNGDPTSGVYDVYRYIDGVQTKEGQIDTAELES